MLYALVEPARQPDRIRLFPSEEAARRSAVGEREPVAVAVFCDAPSHRVFPSWTDPVIFDPTWATPAELHADGSVTARGPIPECLFIVPGPCGAEDENWLWIRQG